MGKFIKPKTKFPDYLIRWETAYWALAALIVGVLAITPDSEPSEPGSSLIYSIVGGIFVLIVFTLIFIFIKLIGKIRKQKDSIKNSSSYKYVTDGDSTTSAHKLSLPKFGGFKSLLTKFVIYGFIIIGLFLSGHIYDGFSVGIGEITANNSIKRIANNSGFSFRGKALFYQNNPELVSADYLNSKCPHLDETGIEYGCYIASDNKIYILEVASSEFEDIEYTTAAHETLHAVWNSLNNNERNKITNELKVYLNDKSGKYTLSETLKPYGSDEQTKESELHSFFGSEYLADSNEVLEKHYQVYFSDQSVAVSANTNFKNKIEEKTSALHNEFAALNNSANQIDLFKGQYLDNIEVALNRSRYYGDIYAYNKNVDAYNKNLEIYNSKVNSYNEEKNKYNREVESFNLILNAFYPSSQKINSK
jgi:hypothetical protein